MACATLGRGVVAILVIAHVAKHVTEALLGIALVGGSLARLCVMVISFASYCLASVRSVYATDLQAAAVQVEAVNEFGAEAAAHSALVYPVGDEGAPKEVVQERGVDAFSRVEG